MLASLRNLFGSLFGDTGKTDSSSIIALYSKDYPKRENGFKIFEGEWTSHIPGYGVGATHLFEDFRVDWIGEQLGGFKDKKILELGPLEGAHSYMMARGGAKSILAIEANWRAFMRCLLVQNALKFDTDFQLGDFRQYLKQTDEKFDFILASGVLYHMEDPEDLLLEMARVSPRIGMWTHYFNPEVIQQNPLLREKFDFNPEIKTVGSRKIKKYSQYYLKAHEWKGFCGAGSIGSKWLERGDILGILEDLGYKIAVGLEQVDHPNGSAFTFYAERKA